jgi:formylmethanofuran dehydrogenase subunit E
VQCTSTQGNNAIAKQGNGKLEVVRTSNKRLRGKRVILKCEIVEFAEKVALRKLAEAEQTIQERNAKNLAEKRAIAYDRR